MDDPNSCIHVLAVSPVDSELVILSNLIGHSSWALQSAATAGNAEAVLREGRIQVVLCDAQLPDADWKTVLRAARKQEHPPEVIVIARAADEALWAEVLNLGAWDVLVKPIQDRELYATVHNAWRHWTCSHIPRRKVASEDRTFRRATAGANAR